MEIGGDTTKLSMALSKVNKEIRDTQANDALAKEEISRSQYDALQREKVSVDYFDMETLEMKEAEMFVEGYKAVLVKDTSFKGLWKVSFTLREF